MSLLGGAVNPLVFNLPCFVSTVERWRCGLLQCVARLCFTAGKDGGKRERGGGVGGRHRV